MELQRPISSDLAAGGGGRARRGRRWTDLAAGGDARSDVVDEEAPLQTHSTPTSSTSHTAARHRASRLEHPSQYIDLPMWVLSNHQPFPT
ncbi:putative LRR receptor-like serine/threonine-protein kinaseisoform X2 [Iris pallida]|uniref:LRR receptor-like serine/threonine-protein kinaseisoform X2 n=1 Tax=Iris pallida TaxID=29817 RepID=A0AAX6G5N2_IRIPA|nr:putative LRR receptor-like serine/threonine-protein kinaseisoform X2 [Iris pallida]